MWSLSEAVDRSQSAAVQASVLAGVHAAALSPKPKYCVEQFYFRVMAVVLKVLGQLTRRRQMFWDGHISAAAASNSGIIYQ